LAKTRTVKGKKRVGRGYGSGRGGHTSGRGSKGDKARGKTKLTFDGTKIKKSWLKRLPLWRGKGRLKPRTVLAIVATEGLERHFAVGEKVTAEALAKKNLAIDGQLVKILYRGKINKALTVEVPCSRRAAAAIKKAGGQVAQKQPK